MQVSKRKPRTGASSLKDKHVEEMLAEVKKKKSGEDDDVASAGREVVENPILDIDEDDDLNEEDEDNNDEGEQGDEPFDNYNDYEEGERKGPRRQVSHGHHMVRGKMAHRMEDYVVAETKTVNGNELGLYGIFDGHSGRDVAKYLQGHLFDNILKEDEFWSNPETAVKRAYKATDEEILENVAGSRGGSTAATAILINRERLVVANVGDSRGILCRRRGIKQITVDHEPEMERELVQSKGGSVSQMPGAGNVPRVDGQLAMTRAFGDSKVKEHITSEPDVRVEKIDEDLKFVVLASDGVWKVMSNEDVSDCVDEEGDAQEAAEELVKKALERGSQDDISCVVVMFE